MRPGARLRRRPLTRIDCLPSPHRRAAFHPLHGTFATGGCDGYVNIWDGAAKKRLFVLPKYPSSVAALSFNHDGSLLVCNGAVATLKRSMLTPGAALSLSGCCVIIHV